MSKEKQGKKRRVRNFRENFNFDDRVQYTRFFTQMKSYEWFSFGGFNLSFPIFHVFESKKQQQNNNYKKQTNKQTTTKKKPKHKNKQTNKKPP